MLSGRRKTTAIITTILLSIMVPVSAALAASEPSQQVSVYLSAEEAALFEFLAETREIIKAYSTKDVELRTLYEGALRGMLEALDDPYSQYLTDDQVAAFISSIEGDYVGVGLTIEMVGRDIRVVSTFGGSPAATAGISAGDLIIAVDGQDMAGRTHQDASVLLRGEQGVPVGVTVFRPTTGEVLEFTLVRSVINPPVIDMKNLGDGIYYIELSQFNSAAGREFPVIMNYLKSKGLKGLVLDLRDNSGGTVDDCVAIAEKLIPQGPIVELRRKDLSEVIENHEDTLPVPTAVLVNEGTASASEILAGAIRDREVGVLVGQPTFGKACVQALIDLGGGMGGLRLTIADYYTPAGHLIADKGLPPDFPVQPTSVIVPAPPAQTRSIGKGSVGLDVLSLQDNLKVLGYHVGESDGILGPRTLAACSEFFADQGMAFEGLVTPELAQLIYYKLYEASTSIPDVQLDTALAVLRAKIETGQWPTVVPCD